MALTKIWARQQSVILQLLQVFQDVRQEPALAAARAAPPPPNPGSRTKKGEEWWASASSALDWALLARSAVVLDVGGGAAAAGDTLAETAHRGEVFDRLESAEPAPGDLLACRWRRAAGW